MPLHRSDIFSEITLHLIKILAAPFLPAGILFVLRPPPRDLAKREPRFRGGAEAASAIAIAPKLIVDIAEFIFRSHGLVAILRVIGTEAQIVRAPA